MAKITLTKIAKFTTKRDGSPLIGANGRPYTALRIKANEYGDKWLSGFDGPQTQSWKEGDSVEVEVVEKGEYLNFSVPKKADANLEAALGPIKTTLGKHEFNIEELKTVVKGLSLLAKKTPLELRKLVEDEERGYPYPESQGEPNFDDFGPFSS